jgi:hypothetical protein
MVGEALGSPGLQCNSVAAPPNNLAQDCNPIGRLKRKQLDPEVGSMYNGGRGQGFGWAPFPPPPIHLPMPAFTMYQPHQQSAEDWNPIGRLKRNKLDSEVGLLCNGGRGQGFGLAPFPPPSIHFPMPESTMYQPPQKPAEAWNPMERPKRKKLHFEVGLMCNGGRGTGLAWTPVPQCGSPTQQLCSGLESHWAP